MYAPLYFEIPTPLGNVANDLSECGTYPNRRNYIGDIESYRSDVMDYNACRHTATQHPAPPAPVAAPTPVITPVMAPPAVTPTPVLTSAIQNAAATGTVSPTPAPAGFSLASLETWLQNSTTLFGFAIPNWALAGGGALLAFGVLGGGSGRRR